MHIIAEIDEAHIADITNGMLVRVKTDSTGEEVLTGKVVFSAPTPTEVQSSTSASDGAKRSATTAVTTTKATYRVEIELDEQNDRLRIGMTAKLEFVIASAKDCIAVPTACIMTDPDGSSYVRVATMPEGGADMSGDGAEETDFEDTEEIPGFTPIPEDDVIIEGGMSTGDEDMAGTGHAPAAGEMDGMIDESGMLIREVKVTTGVSDGYYTEITSGNIQEGDMIESPEMDYGGMGGWLDGIYG